LSVFAMPITTLIRLQHNFSMNTHQCLAKYEPSAQQAIPSNHGRLNLLRWVDSRNRHCCSDFYFRSLHPGHSSSGLTVMACISILSVILARTALLRVLLAPSAMAHPLCAIDSKKLATGGGAVESGRFIDLNGRASWSWSGRLPWTARGGMDWVDWGPDLKEVRSQQGGQKEVWVSPSPVWTAGGGLGV